ncbi:MAG: phasin family protein [Rubricoccaceae bacterium]|nr:phasin family protein [Rubricoccaceae bacterium]
MTKTQQLQEEIKKTADEALSLVKNTTEAAQKSFSDVTGEVRTAAQKIFNAGLGALAIAGEESSNFFSRLAEKGEGMEFSGFGADQITKLREQLDERTDKVSDAVKGRVKDAKFMAEEASEKFEDRVQEAVAVVMKRIGVPTREEINELTASVERLTKHVKKLKENRGQAKGFTMEAVGGGWYELKVGDLVVEKVQGKEEAEAALQRLETQQV